MHFSKKYSKLGGKGACVHNDKFISQWIVKKISEAMEKYLKQ